MNDLAHFFGKIQNGRLQSCSCNSCSAGSHDPTTDFLRVAGTRSAKQEGLGDAGFGDYISSSRNPESDFSFCLSVK